MMRGATLFSGIGAPEVACPEIDWRWCAEHDPAAKRGHGFAARVHEVRHGIPNLGDVNKVNFNDQPKIDVLVFGSPCQSFSVAGKRAGLDDPRGNMALIGLGAARQLGAQWLVFENVPGLLSNDKGRDFGIFLGLLGQLGYGFAYRVLDAQYTGVPQRRRRIILVGYLGDWRRAAAVLFEPGGLRRDPAPRRQARAHVAAPLAASPAGGSGWRADADTAENYVAYALSAHPGPHGRLDASVETLIAPAVIASDGKRGKSRHEGAALVLQTRGSNLSIGETSGTIGSNADRASGGAPMVFDPAQITSPHNRAAVAPGGVAPSLAESGHAPTLAFSRTQYGQDIQNDQTPTLRAMDGKHRNAGGQIAAHMSSGVRRLTPRECERLQGFPDDFTAIEWRGKPAPDGPRYRALGNSMAVPVMRWVLRRLQKVHAL